jgi:Tol biopolymer transport system component
MPDGTGIVFASGTTSTRGLWRLALGKPARPRRLAFAPGDVSAPVLSRHLTRLAYSLEKLESNIWRVDLGDSGRKAETPVRFISSTKWDAAPAYSPTGGKIAFVSSRSGTPEVWVCESDGSMAVPITNLGGPLPSSPRWSWDGRNIGFWSEQGGRADVYVVSAGGGGIPRRVATHPAGGKFPFWSRDGQSLYFASVDWQIWKVSLAGGPAIQMTRNGGDVPQASPDGQFVYFQRRSADRVSVWRIPVNGGDEAKVVDSVHPKGKWTVGDTGIYFFTAPDERGHSEIRCYEFANGNTRKVMTIDHDISYGLALSPDGRTLLYTRIDEAGSDLMLVENFR